MDTSTIPNGKPAIHHASAKCLTLDIMLPKDGVDGGTPIPRNDKEDSMNRPIRKASAKPTGYSTIPRRITS